MAAPPEATEAPPPPEDREGTAKDGVEVCLFDESADGFSRAVRAISELADLEPEPDFPDAEVERLASSITFLREWRHFSYEPKDISFNTGIKSASSRDGMHSISLPQFSAATVPQVTQQEDRRDNTVSFDFILFAGGNVWALDWCPRLCDKPGSSINCEYLAVSAHPPGSSYHKIGMPLTGRGIIQIWCLLAPFEDAHSRRPLDACNNISRRGRPRKIPDGTNSVGCSSNPPKPRGRPRKRPYNDQLEPVPKRPRGRPRKYPLPVAKLEDSSQNSGCQAIVLFDPLATSTASLFTSSSTAISEKSKGQRSRAQNKKKTISYELCSPVVSGVEPRSMGSTETILNGPMASVKNTLISAQNMVSVSSDLCSANMFHSDENVHKGALSCDLVQPIHISPKSRQSSGRRGRGRPKRNPLSVGTSSLVASGASSTKTTSVLTSSDNLTSLDKSDGEFIASNLGSIGSSGCGIEKSSVRLGVVSSDAASPRHGLYNANCKEESSTKRGSGSRKKPVSTEHSHFTDFNGNEQKMQTNLKSSDPVVLVENCMKGPCPRKGGGQPQRISASNESNGTSVCAETHTMERFSTSMTTASPRSEDMADEAGLIQSDNGIVGCEGMKVSESSTANVTSRCNGSAQANQAAPSFKNSDRVIDEVEATELVPLKEPREDDNMFSCAENSNSSPVPKDIALPRVVLCLAHNGKVAWDIKWKPPLLSQPEQKSRLGFLAVLLGNGSLEVWEVPSPCMIQKLYSSSKVEGSDPRFLKLQPVFRSVKVKCGNRQSHYLFIMVNSIPLTVDWSPSPPHDMILAGCHDGTVALWNFSTNLSSQDSKPFMCVTAESVPIRALSWAPYISEENINTFVTAGADGLKFWDLRDPYRPLWELATAPRAVLSVQWLKNGRGIVISMEDGTLKFLSLPRIANDVPATGRPFVGTKTQGVATYQLSEYLIWSVHASDTTDDRRKQSEKNSMKQKKTRVALITSLDLYNFSPVNKLQVCDRSVTYTDESIAFVVDLSLMLMGIPDEWLDAVTSCAAYCGADGTAVCFQLTPRFWEKEPGRNRVPYFLCGSLSEEGENIKIGSGQQMSPLPNVPVVNKKEHEDDGTLNSKGVESPKDFEVFPPKSVALHRVRWNVNKGSERWLCYGGAAGIIRCQRI
ncbi:uncharacterized protein C2845_PM07G29300 [Panicum miliaceum]|uniref:Transducin/WD40 repeat-like superfamily protein n=1 Tax=Panicum miliaceum TaxID=4540 RepID=A0A3L6SKJ0_PANMI|nr:uncharacterized protein C2845_PM07G29300 [Panicum miliaceum]